MQEPKYCVFFCITDEVREDMWGGSGTTTTTK